MWDDNQYKDFRCPLCGSDGYVRVRVKKRNGDWYSTEFYACFGCSVMFTDPVKFTQQKRVVQEMPPVAGRYGIRVASQIEEH